MESEPFSQTGCVSDLSQSEPIEKTESAVDVKREPSMYVDLSSRHVNSWESKGLEHSEHRSGNQMSKVKHKANIWVQLKVKDTTSDIKTGAFTTDTSSHDETEAATDTLEMAPCNAVRSDSLSGMDECRDKAQAGKQNSDDPSSLPCQVSGLCPPSAYGETTLSFAAYKPYTCDVCFKTFAQGCNLKTHKLIHNGQRPFECDVCGKTFVQSCYLKRHKMLHSGEKSFVCEVCNKIFIQACSLETHRMTHTSQRPYAFY